MKITNIIPVTALNGSDSVFLSAFLNNAVENNQTILTFDRFGSTAFTANTMVGFDESDRPEYFTTTVAEQFPIDKFSKVFISTFITVDSILYLFDKSIKIIIEEDDAETLALEFLGKFIINVKNAPPASWLETYEERLAMVPYTTPYYLSATEDVLTITKKELMSESATELINKLSVYTDIPIEHFNIDNLIEWRAATARGVTETKSQIEALKKS